MESMVAKIGEFPFGDRPLEGTRLKLIQVAGELFAERGINGASIREIAQRAEVNIAAVNYHFGSKENLHLAVLHYAYMELGISSPESYLKNDDWFVDDNSKARLIRTIVQERFDKYFAPDKPDWLGQVLIRSFLIRSHPVEIVLSRNWNPIHEALIRIFQRCKPSLSADEARYWAFSLIGEIYFYKCAQVPVQIIAHEAEHLSGDFLSGAANHISGLLIRALGLQVTNE